MSKRLVLLGAGHAHVQVLEAMAREPMAGVDAVLVTPHPRVLYSGLLPGWLAGRWPLAACGFDVQPLAQAARVPFIAGEAVAIDAAARRVSLADGSVAEYDLLSLDVGSAMARDAIPGAREHALFLRPLDTFARLVDGLWDLAARRVLDVVVIGGGAGGFELALAIARRLCGRGEEQARVALVTGGGAPLGGYPAGVRRRAAQQLARARVTVFRDACVRLERGVAHLASGARIACDAPIVATGPQAPRWLLGSGLRLDDQGHVLTGPTLQSVSHPEVYAAGDVASRADAPHPKSGVLAVRAGPALALNLRRHAAGGALQAWTPPRRTLNLLACGDGSALLAWGGWATHGRWCGWWKDRIDRAWVDRFSRARPG